MDSFQGRASGFGPDPGTKLTNYVLRFDPEVFAYFRERVWHPSQWPRNLPGRRVELIFRCGESWEVESWVAWK